MADTSEQITIYIDNVPYHVNRDNNLLAGVLSQKLNLPYFCWHPAMGSVGACRQCAVTQYQDENDTRGRLVMACTTPVSEGMRISLKDTASVDFREQVIAAMMTNHPHDCPVCAEGGECHLQDMTVMTGHSARHYHGSKRTFTNQYLGDLVGHEMNRCITCYRCVRFYKDYAGGNDFDVFGSKNQVYFGRQSDGPLESEFSGNLVEVCPTGVFTNRQFSAHYTRKWDLQSAPSICAHCSVGCNTSIGERYGSVRRVVNRFNDEINGYFLCDRGRFGIGFVNGEQRILTTKGIKQQSPDRLTTLDVAKSLVHFRGKKFIGIGSGRASLEANFYLQQIVGNASFCAGFTAKQMALAAQHNQILEHHHIPSLLEIEQSDFILIVGEDITQSSPRVALSIRQALRNASIEKAASIGIPAWQDSAVRTVGGKTLSPLYSLNCIPTKLDEVSEQVLQISPAMIERCIAVMCQSINPDSEQSEVSTSTAVLNQQQQAFISQLVSSLRQAKKPLILSGWTLQSPSLIAAVNRLVACIKRAIEQQNINACALNVAIFPDEANTTGLLSLLDEQTLSTEQVLSQLEDQQLAGLVILEQDLSALSDTELAMLRERANTIIALEHSDSRVTNLADIVMPVGAISECDGHFVNYQGAVQRFYQVHAPKLPIMDNWRWLDLLRMSVLNAGNHTNSPLVSHDNINSLAHLHDFFRHCCQQWPLDIQVNDASELSARNVARQTHRTSGRTAQTANISVHELKAMQSKNGSKLNNFSFSMEGVGVNQAKDMPFTWAPGWNSNQSINQYQTQVGQALSNKGCNAHLAILNSAQLIPQWPINDAEQLSGAKTPSAAISEDVLVNFVQSRPWYMVDTQASFLPEFALMNKGNCLFISTEIAHANQFTHGQYVKLSYSGYQAITQLGIDEHFNGDFCYGILDGLAKTDTNITVQLSQVTDDEIAKYIEQQKLRAQQLAQSKANILERLKERDQFIPVRMISGGLDDA
ncbi:NADH-quinone oxidoreductase subunit NuoG [Colwelliaceae bacterium 6471]